MDYTPGCCWSDRTVTTSSREISRLGREGRIDRKGQRWTTRCSKSERKKGTTVCRFLGMVDYPIPMNQFEDKEAFDKYAVPLFKSVNPDAHPLTLMTLVKAKWFEVMFKNLIN